MMFFSSAGQLVGQIYSLLPVIMGRKGSFILLGRICSIAGQFGGHEYRV